MAFFYRQCGATYGLKCVVGQMCMRTRIEWDTLRPNILRKPFCTPCVIHNRHLTKGLVMERREQNLSCVKRQKHVLVNPDEFGLNIVCFIEGKP